MTPEMRAALEALFLELTMNADKLPREANAAALEAMRLFYGVTR